MSDKTAIDMMFPNGRDECEHGSLRRKCLICELQAEIARLTAERDESWRLALSESAHRIEAEKERDGARAEVERLHPALRLHVEQLQELLGASREEVRRLREAGDALLDAILTLAERAARCGWKDTDRSVEEQVNAARRALAGEGNNP